jgi:hypothetical protein
MQYFINKLILDDVAYLQRRFNSRINTVDVRSIAGDANSVS